jgi:hypothetical protein
MRRDQAVQAVAVGDRLVVIVEALGACGPLLGKGQRGERVGRAAVIFGGEGRLDVLVSSRSKNRGKTGARYLGVIKVGHILLKNHVISQMGRMRQSASEFVHRELGPGRRQSFAVLCLELPIGAVDAPLEEVRSCKIRPRAVRS